MKGKTALLIGATGLVGGELLKQLLEDPAYDTVHVFVRRSTGKQHPKLQEHVIDFGNQESWSGLVKGDVLFSALGTTRKKAGSEAAQYLVDYTYQYQFAQAAQTNGVHTYVLVSSVGADANSSFFYTKTKGQLDRDVQALGFKKVCILRPGPLVGPREQPRIGEAWAVGFMRVVNAVGLLKQYKPISGEEVATVMRKVAQMQGSVAKIYEPLEIFAQLS